eukprot:574349-Hanusia_phi.AAC.4
MRPRAQVQGTIQLRLAAVRRIFRSRFETGTLAARASRDWTRRVTRRPAAGPRPLSLECFTLKLCR